jgi:hypothetical protein
VASSASNGSYQDMPSGMSKTSIRPTNDFGMDRIERKAERFLNAFDEYKSQVRACQVYIYRYMMKIVQPTDS